jgi:hypothetical protein
MDIISRSAQINDEKNGEYVNENLGSSENMVETNQLSPAFKIGIYGRIILVLIV